METRTAEFAAAVVVAFLLRAASGAWHLLNGTFRRLPRRPTVSSPLEVRIRYRLRSRLPSDRELEQIFVIDVRIANPTEADRAWLGRTLKHELNGIHSSNVRQGADR
jgi:hypothetical protein